MRNYLQPRGLARAGDPGARRRAREARGAAGPARGARRVEQAAGDRRASSAGVELRFEREAPARAAGSSARSRRPTSRTRSGRRQKIRVDRRKIDLPETIKRVGRYTVPITIFEDVKVEMPRRSSSPRAASCRPRTRSPPGRPRSAPRSRRRDEPEVEEAPRSSRPCCAEEEAGAAEADAEAAGDAEAEAPRTPGRPPAPRTRSRPPGPPTRRPPRRARGGEPEAAEPEASTSPPSRTSRCRRARAESERARSRGGSAVLHTSVPRPSPVAPALWAKATKFPLRADGLSTGPGVRIRPPPSGRPANIRSIMAANGHFSTLWTTRSTDPLDTAAQVMANGALRRMAKPSKPPPSPRRISTPRSPSSAR